MSSYYRERRAAGLFDPDEEVRANAEAKLNKDMAKRQDLGVPAVGDMKADAAINEQRIEEAEKK